MIRYYRCPVCGKRGLDNSPSKNKKFCSQKCNNTYHNRIRWSGKSCKFNEGVCCTSHKCKNCGWNPKVALKRTEALV